MSIFVRSHLFVEKYILTFFKISAFESANFSEVEELICYQEFEIKIKDNNRISKFSNLFRFKIKISLNDQLYEFKC